MGDQAGQSAIEIRIDEASMTASLYIPSKQDTITLETEAVLALIREKRIEVTPVVEARVAEIVADFKGHPRRMEEVFVEAQPAEHGCDAYFAWLPNMDPTTTRRTAPMADGDEQVDFYNLSSMIRVEPGNVIAVFHEASVGANGRDIYGRIIEARPGKPTEVVLDATVTKHGDGRITANIGGSLDLKANTLRVSRLLEVDGCVDFSIGNIKFDGTILVRDAVRDRFEVTASEDVVVEGLIEAATISAGGNFISRRGMAARNIGQIRVDGNAEAGFLNNVRGYVRGDLVVRREVMNCDLAVGGNLSCQDGVIIGGNMAVMKRARIGVVGSEGGAPTTISLGSAPLLSAELRQIEARLIKLRRVLEQHTIVAASNRVGRGVARATVNPEIAAINEKIASSDSRREQILQQIRTERLIELHVTKLLHARVCLRAFDTAIVIGQPIKGPFVVMWDPENGLHYRQGNTGAKPLPMMQR
jgi:uncharacterized protein (DUF342 family)